MSSLVDDFVLEVDDLDADAAAPKQKDEAVVEDSVPPAKSSSATPEKEPTEKLLVVEKKQNPLEHKEPEPCTNFRLDVKAGFGTCKCGHSRKAHEQTKKNKAAEMLTNLKVRNSAQGDDLPQLEPGDAPCANFRLDVNATTFGTCKCGFVRKEHGEKVTNKAKLALETLRSSNVDDWKKATEEDGVCDNFRLDVNATTFGSCKCGYKKDDHIKKEANAAEKMLKRLKETNEEKNRRADDVAAGKTMEEPIPSEENPVSTLEKEEQRAAEQANKPEEKKKPKQGCGCVVS